MKAILPERRVLVNFVMTGILRLMNASDKNNSNRVEGQIRMSQKGMGFVIPLTDEGRLPRRDESESIFIPPEDVGTALPLDIVTAIVTGENEQGPIGEVADIVLRHKTQFVGTVEKEGEEFVLDPDDERVPVQFLLRKGATPEMVGKKVLTRMDKWTDSKSRPTAEVMEVLGEKGDNETEMRAIVLDRGLFIGFPPEVEQAASEIPREITEEEISKRRDMRDVLTFTIDPADAKDFDDALSYRETSDGDIEVGIHIADVSHYVEEGGPIDVEAERRGTSIYLVDRVIPMLPEVLSNDLCSLNPNEDKLAFSAVFTFSKKALADGKAEITDRWFGRTVIHSDQRFTYEQAQKALDESGQQYHKELKTIDDIARLLRKERFEKGAIAFEQDEVKFELDEHGAPVAVHAKERIETNRLIEDLMLLANKEVAKFIATSDENVKSTFIYRNHDVPDQDRIRELSNFLKSIGYKLPVGEEGVSSKDINALLEKIEGTPEEDLVQTAVIRTMAKAVYSTKNIGHFGLGFTHYTHFTSPIRRYPDLMVHRFLACYLAGTPVSLEKLKEFEAASRYASTMEQNAADAERTSIKLKQVEYMAERIGEEFTGVISGVAKWGIYVQEENSHADGLVHISQLGDDYFSLDEKKYRIIGERTKKVFSLGDKVKVRVKDVDMKKRQINYELVE